MKLSEFSVKNPVFAWMLMGSIFLFGGLAFTRLGVSQLPDVDFPVINVNYSLEGAAPEVLEKEVVDTVESALMGVEGVQNISASIRSGFANITLDFDLSRNIDLALQDVQNKLSEIATRLPKDIIGPTIRKTNPEDQPILWLSVRSSNISRQDLMALVRDQVQPRFLTIPGVGDIHLGGYVDPNLRVYIQKEKLKQFELSIDDVIGAIQSEHKEYPAGTLIQGSKELNLRAEGEAETLEQFQKLLITRRGGRVNAQPIRLGDLGYVEEGLADIRRLSRVNGEASVGMGIRKQRGSNAVEVADRVKARMAEIEKSLPEGVKMQVNFDTTVFIKQSVNDMIHELVLASVLTALVCWFFLGSLSSTFNVILAIPISIVGTFFVMRAFGFTLNTFTLLALTLSIGIVVDDAIMVLENIVRHAEKGLHRVKASLVGSAEVAYAALAATLAIVAIFIPVGYVEGVVGKFFYQFAVTLSVAVLISYVEAMSFTPMRTASFLAIAHGNSWLGRIRENMFNFLEGFYSRWLQRTQKKPWLVIGVSAVIFGLSLTILPALKKEFVPSQDQGRLFIRVKAPDGTSLETTNEIVKSIETYVKGLPQVNSYFANVGGFGGGEVNTANVMITLVDKKDRKETHLELMEMLRKHFRQEKRANVSVIDMSLNAFGGRRGYPLEFSLRGPDWSQLQQSTNAFLKAVKDAGISDDLDSDLSGGNPEIRIVPDRDKARVYGVSVESIGRSIQAMMGSVVVAKYSKGASRNDIRVSLVEEERKDLNTLKQVSVRNLFGELVPLSQVVKVEEVPGQNMITRENRERSVSIFGNINKDVSQERALKKMQEIAKEVLPPEVRLVASGGAKAFQDAGKGFGFALLLGILIAYMVLASQYNSFADPLCVLMSLPLSISGALLALLISGQSFNLYSGIGILLLMGLVKKNAILIVDFSNQLKAKGVSPAQAVLEAAPLRMRAILMTSIATISAAIPTVIGFGEGSESRVPMAIVIIAGVMVSTVFTFFLTPALYALISRPVKSEV